MTEFELAMTRPLEEKAQIVVYTEVPNNIDDLSAKDRFVFEELLTMEDHFVRPKYPADTEGGPPGYAADKNAVFVRKVDPDRRLRFFVNASPFLFAFAEPQQALAFA